jgi:transglutaminase-like putative cysteine protease
LTYEYGVTNVTTTAAEALAAGRGVCQDAAHIMVALCRLAGLAARYVSGHLLGQGGTHAWVEVIVAHRDAAVAVPFDPCHGRRTDHRYVTVAVGRDYADVAPTSGSYVGPPGGQLTGTRQVGIISLDGPRT